MALQWPLVAAAGYHAPRSYAPGLTRALWACPRYTPQKPLALRHGRKSPRGNAAIMASMDDYWQHLEEPTEPIRPGFSRDILDGRGKAVLIEEGKASSTSSLSRRKKGRKFRKATPLQALSGSLISGTCSLGLLLGLLRMLEHLQEHELVREAPLGMKDDLNSLIFSMVVFFGGLAVLMFGFASLGLLMLALNSSASSASATQTPSSPPPPSPSPSHGPRQ
eukprot:TRINITY_DN2630_c0_g1_i2.p1 TRINITY_DN2630_c0_g1~~TRINITY_DN2630_c0_g1_i2.p1  ORF type:complete len:221 (+),score=39.66 TRINITY_DN2630_c0_g1_i2:147-809(+)